MSSERRCVIGWGGAFLIGGVCTSLMQPGRGFAQASAVKEGSPAAQPPRFSEQSAGRLILPSDEPASTNDAASASRSPGPPGAGSASDEPDDWRHRRVRGVAANRYRLINDQDTVVLGVDVAASASALIARLRAPVRGRLMRWRWRAEGFPPLAALWQRERDDFAARIYLMFDLPDDRLSLADRVVLGGASLLQGERVPAATLVYLLHAGPADDRLVPSPFTDRVMMRVARARAGVGQWYEEECDWQHDFQRAFGARYPGPTPTPVAVAVGSDGDQTGAVFSARFGDLVFS